MTGLNEIIGSEAWWQQQISEGIPHISPATDGQCQVTFYWRDPQGDESTSGTQRVWINITGVTDHHQQAAPVSLTRLPGTDVWQWQTSLAPTWRGSYCLMPDTQPDTFQASPDMYALRAWWREKFPVAQADPLNRLRSWSGGRGMAVSPLHMPSAPDQSLWQRVDEGRAPEVTLQPHRWQSALLGNSRSVWILTTGDAQPHQRPLALLLDGQFWANSMPVADPLQQLTDRGELPPAVYVMIDIIDREHRSAELTCNPDFWRAIQQELLPLVAEWAPCSQNAETTLVAGQSFGGLSSVYAALNWPQSFGAAVSLSGSFWWPERNTPQGWLVQQLQQGAVSAPTSRFYLTAGRRERLIFEANNHLNAELTASGHQVSFHPIEGGHDALCWRGSLLDGLKAMWQSR